MDPFRTRPIRGERPLRHDQDASPEDPAPKRSATRDAAILTGLIVTLPVLLAVLGYLTGGLRGPAGALGLGLVLLAGSKGVAVRAFGAMRGWRNAASNSESAALVEGLTLGSLVAFVASLALGPIVLLPRSLLLIDWAATVAILAVIRRIRPRPEKHIASNGDRDVSDPQVAAMIRDQRILLAGGDREGLLAMVREVRSYGPDPLHVAGPESAKGRRIGPVVKSIPPGGSIEFSARKILATPLPDVVIFVPGQDDAIRDVALGARRLVGEALRSGVEAFVLVVPDRGSVGHRLAEQILQSLSGLSRSRLICVRVGASISQSQVAKAVLKIAAMRPDGTVVSLGRRGARVEERAPGSRDAEALWSELDRIEAESRTA